ncbi:histone RNA hairpin-binding protein RNA-binding domain-containing protein [Pavlovales sp. CCMP2436]|nr:histone RNA hairpin-binding protein RNA-binding domain-containing protein [Pavlovales sp. CCMP2436]
MPKVGRDTGSAVERNHVYGEQKREAVASKKGEATPGSRETDGHKLGQRLKQLEYGYNTLGYTNYLQGVPKTTRAREQPRTPDRHKVMSKRAWEGLIRKWRRQLHDWDPLELQGERGGAAKLGGLADDGDADDESPDAGSETVSPPPAEQAATSFAAAFAAAPAKGDDGNAGLVACRPPSDDEEDEGPTAMLITPVKPKPAPRARDASQPPGTGTGLFGAFSGDAEDTRVSDSPASDLTGDSGYGEFQTDL